MCKKIPWIRRERANVDITATSFVIRTKSVGYGCVQMIDQKKIGVASKLSLSI